MKTTKAHFKKFRRYCLKYIRAFGLTDYTYRFVHGGEKRASFCCQTVARHITLRFAREWDDDDAPLTDYEIKETAFHEVMEASMARLSLMATQARGFHEDEVDRECHAVIQRWVNFYFKSLEKED